MLQYRAFTSAKRRIIVFYILHYLSCYCHFMWFFSCFPIVTVKLVMLLVGKSQQTEPETSRHPGLGCCSSV